MPPPQLSVRLAAALGGAVGAGAGRDAQQGDYAFTAILERSSPVTRGDVHPRQRLGALRGVDVDMHHISDTVMTLAAIAPLASGPTRIRNVANIRIKETDRLAATVIELRRSISRSRTAPTGWRSSRRRSRRRW
jgi:3-phosphoshikimate 1-carboxyvinyltransferase